MLINNVHIIGNEKNARQIEIEGTKIKDIRPAGNSIKSRDEINLILSDAIAFPGLINSHDHLEFNLFPKLRSRFYKDYIEWGNDIHTLYNDQIERIKEIPYELRFKWGMYKNLICGVTTVVHHGNGAVFHFEDLPEIHINYNYLHSTRLEKKWKIKLNLNSGSFPFVIHIGEGINRKSVREANELIRWNIFRKRLIGVHGISLNEKQGKKFQALVWCPDSNLFLYDKTADIQKLKKYTKILFGTDSTLSSDWNIWNQVRSARRLNYLTNEELYNSLTETASVEWQLDSAGKISPAGKADIVVAKKKSGNLWESFYSINPEDILLIIKNGKIAFIDKNLQNSQPVINEKDFDLVDINSVHKYITKGITDLMLSILNYIPGYKFPVKTVS